MICKNVKDELATLNFRVYQLEMHSGLVQAIKAPNANSDMAEHCKQSDSGEPEDDFDDEYDDEESICDSLDCDDADCDGVDCKNKPTHKISRIEVQKGKAISGSISNNDPIVRELDSYDRIISKRKNLKEKLGIIEEKEDLLQDNLNAVIGKIEMYESSPKKNKKSKSIICMLKKKENWLKIAIEDTQEFYSKIKVELEKRKADLKEELKALEM